MPTPNSERICFVVQPMHDRADNVYEWYLKPALEPDFALRQPGTPSLAITEDIFDHLKRDALVVVYLGSPFQVPAAGNNWLWNPNVMLEAGYRLALNLPIVFVREKRVHQDEPILPFDLFNITVIELPSADEENIRENRRRVIARINESAQAVRDAALPETETLNSYPVVSMSFGVRGGNVTWVSEDAAAFFHYPSDRKLIGLDIRELVRQLVSEMAPSQRSAFQAEQDQLIGALFLRRKPFATVCIVFGKDSIQPGATPENAYLPIVTSFRTTRGELTLLDVLYLNVKAIAHADEDGVVRCRLGQD